MDSTRGGSTRALLRFGVVAGPFYLFVGLTQALVRDGFDLGRHSLSALANGSGGWVQTANFGLTGLMVVAAAIGIGRAVRPRSRLAAGLLAFFGISMLAAAVFRADPVDGFPIGTPEGYPSDVSTAGVLHFAAGGLGFLALAASCIAMAFTMARLEERRIARLSFIAGLAVVGGFFAPFLVPASGPVAGIWFSVVVGWTWLALVSAHLQRSRA